MNFHPLDENGKIFKGKIFQFLKAYYIPYKQNVLF